jgi:predicted negative regulator of RcsB-dependent stress response
VAKLTRKQLKKDRFVEEVGEAVGIFTTHRNLIIGIAVGVLVLVVAGAAFYRYQQEQDTEARLALQEALGNYYGQVSLNRIPGRVTFATTIAKDEAIRESLTKVSEDFAGRLEGEVARLHLALYEVSDGDLDKGKTMLEGLLDHRNDEVAALARKALADQLQREGKNEEAVPHYQHLVDNPTDMMPRERVELFGLYDALLATDEQKALELVKSIEERDGAGREIAARMRAGLESRLGITTPPMPPPVATPPGS